MEDDMRRKHEDIDNFVNAVESVTDVNMDESTVETLHGCLDHIHQVYQQADAYPPIMFYVVSMLFFGMSIGFFVFAKSIIYDKSPGMYLFMGFSAFFWFVIWCIPPLLTLYVNTGDYRYETVRIIGLADSSVNSTTVNGHTTFAERIILENMEGQQFSYELGRKKPARKFCEGEMIKIRVRGKYWLPVDRLYK